MTVVVIDLGHGGDDTGTAVGQRWEKSYNLELSARVLQLASGLPGDLQVIRTRERDIDPTFWQRAQVAENAGASLVISLHVNAQRLPENIPPDIQWYYGGECFYMADEPYAARIARVIQEALPRELLHGSRREPLIPVPREGPAARADRGPWYVLRKYHCPAVLLECAYATYRANLQVLLSSEGKWGLARAVVEGISKHLEWYREDSHGYETRTDERAGEGRLPDK